MKKAVDLLGRIETVAYGGSDEEVTAEVRDMFSPKELEDLCQEIANLVNSELAFDV